MDKYYRFNEDQEVTFQLRKFRIVNNRQREIFLVSLETKEVCSFLRKHNIVNN